MVFLLKLPMSLKMFNNVYQLQMMRHKGILSPSKDLYLWHSYSLTASQVKTKI